ncbi:chitin synthase-domain-containing protein [Jimgerdemannia flammicorona]|uniref:Chitin synthase-domain-containing protein n=1 Tax=Jimgerdemannia flammicorona TaxID=994334 RepID=A0A433CZD0_9FUNG|nr:chitin synthase-domain-containing protein [Jimgerdemannia flammicorona]
MTPLEFDLFEKVRGLVGVTADKYEMVLMVDADTRMYCLIRLSLVKPDSLARMVVAMERDPEVMGLCGETKIANKSQSVRILYLTPSRQSIRIHFRWCHMSSRLFLHVPCEGPKVRRLHRPDPGQPRDRRDVLVERSGYAAPKEPPPARGGPVLDHAHDPHLSQAQDDVRAQGRVQDSGAGQLQRASFAAPTLDQLDHPQPHGAHSRSPALRHLLLLHAVRRLPRPSWHHRVARRADALDPAHRCRDCVSPGRSIAAAVHVGAVRNASNLDFAHNAQASVCAVDARVHLCHSYLEFRVARLCVLAL